MVREDLLSDPRYADLKSRVDHMDDIDALVSDFTARHSKQHLFDLLMQHRVPCAPVRKLDEVVNDAHMHERGALEWVEHPMYGRVCLMRSPLRFQGSEPLAIRPSGELGRDNHEVYGQWLGLSDSQLRQLVDEEVI
jgi:crotonobetainyl-CoA:carnitine CoA-transferase CaiB-like acyl-CoA transferase